MGVRTDPMGVITDDARHSRLSRLASRLSEGGTHARASITHLKSKQRSFPSIDAMLSQIGFGCYTAVLVLALSLAQMAMSLNTNLLSFLMPCAGAAFQVDITAYGTLGTIYNTASYFATPIFGAIADSRGRRTAVVLSVVIMGVAGGGAATSQSWLALCLWMGLMGVGLGGVMVPFDLLSEVAPPKQRGAVLNLTNWFWCAGSILVLVAAWFSVGSLAPGFPPSSWEPWRVLVLMVVTPVLFALVLTPALVESPHWLVEQGRCDEAMAVLEKIARLNCRPPISGDAGLGDSLLTARLSARPSAGLRDSLLDLVADDGADADVGAGAGGVTARLDPGAVRLSRLSQGVSMSARANHERAAATPAERAARLCLKPLGLGGAVDILAEPALRQRALTHWLLWLIAGFGWAGTVYFQTFILGNNGSGSDDAGDAGSGPTNASSAFACDFDYTAQLPVLASELPGTLLVQLVVDSPRGPFGLWGGRRGVQICAFTVLATSSATMALGVGVIGSTAVTVLAALSRFSLAAGNSAMWIAAPEMYPTRVRGLGANTAFLFNVMGCIPASNWVYSGLPGWLIGAVIAAANLSVAVIASFLPETAGIGFDEDH